MSAPTFTKRYDSQDGRLRGRAGKARRLRIWALDPHCAKCGDAVAYDVKPHAFEVDHKVRLADGGKDEDENLQVLCIPCHEDKTAMEARHKDRPQFDSSGRVKW